MTMRALWASRVRRLDSWTADTQWILAAPIADVRFVASELWPFDMFRIQQDVTRMRLEFVDRIVDEIYESVKTLSGTTVRLQRLAAVLGMDEDERATNGSTAAYLALASDMQHRAYALLNTLRNKLLTA